MMVNHAYSLKTVSTVTSNACLFQVLTDLLQYVDLFVSELSVTETDPMKSEKLAKLRLSHIEWNNLKEFHDILSVSNLYSSNGVKIFTFLHSMLTALNKPFHQKISLVCILQFLCSKLSMLHGPRSAERLHHIFTKLL